MSQHLPYEAGRHQLGMYSPKRWMTMMDRGASYHYTATNAPQDTTAAVCERVSLCCLCPLIVNVDHTSFTVNYHQLKLSQSHQQDGGIAPGTS